MNKDQIKGAAKEVKGGIKETVGRVTGSKSTELEGKVEKNLGTAQRKAGDLRDKVENPKH